MSKLLLVFLVACAPPPYEDGQCHTVGGRYEGNKFMGVSMCKYQGYWWRCHHGHRPVDMVCVQEAQLEAEAK